MEIARLLDTESFRKANCSLHPFRVTFFGYSLSAIFFSRIIFFLERQRWSHRGKSWYPRGIIFYSYSSLLNVSYFSIRTNFFFFSFFLSKRLEYFLVHFRLANFPPPPPVRGRGMRGSDAAYEKLICLFTSPLSGRRKGVGVRIFACVSKSGRCYRRHARSR